MKFEEPLIPMAALIADILRLLPEYLPGVETGAATSTEGRSCWIKSWKALLTVLGREQGLEVVVLEDGGDSALQRQLTIFWKRGDAIMLAALSGWGDRTDLERRFQQLETLKAPHKLFLYSCLKWQEAVIEQLEAALLRYPHHIEGEQYVTLNLMGSTQALGAHMFTVPRSGPLKLADVSGFLQQLSGSPFAWRASRGAGHGSR
jgi:hypothetical protein